MPTAFKRPLLMLKSAPAPSPIRACRRSLRRWSLDRHVARPDDVQVTLRRDALDKLGDPDKVDLWLHTSHPGDAHEAASGD
jgi:hypothetical protein